MRKSALLFLITLLTITYSSGQTSPEVVVPNFDDKFCEYVKMLEAGQTDIDYRDFRFSFIESEQFRIANGRLLEFDSLKRGMYFQMESSNYPEIIRIAKQMLSIDYTSMIAHKILRQTYKITGDTINAAKYKAIQFGLLKSIVNTGDGKTCATAWEVVQVQEEYFILDMLNASLLEQELLDTDGLCDKMKVSMEDGEIKTYYFEISKIFECYKRFGLK